MFATAAIASERCTFSFALRLRTRVPPPASIPQHEGSPPSRAPQRWPTHRPQHGVQSGTRRTAGPPPRPAPGRSAPPAPSSSPRCRYRPRTSACCHASSSTRPRPDARTTDGTNASPPANPNAAWTMRPFAASVPARALGRPGSRTGSATPPHRKPGTHSRRPTRESSQIQTSIRMQETRAQKEIPNLKGWGKSWTWNPVHTGQDRLTITARPSSHPQHQTPQHTDSTIHFTTLHLTYRKPPPQKPTRRPAPDAPVGGLPGTPARSRRPPAPASSV